MKTSTFQIIFLAAFGALAVAGILVFAIATSSNSQQTLGSVVIWGPWNAGAVNGVLRDAADNNGQLLGVSYVQKNPATYEDDLTNALASGTGPDLFVMRQDYALVDASKAYAIPFTQLAQSQFQNTFVGAANAFLGSSGTIALPLVADPLVLYWNRDMLTSAGYAQPPQYWDQFFDIATNITKRSDAGAILLSGVALGTYDNIPDAKDIITLLLLQSGNTITTYDSQGNLTSTLVPHQGGNAQAAPSAVRFYTGFADASQNYYSWNGSLSSSTLAFAQGQLALYIGYASELRTIQQANPNLNFGIAPVPQVRNSNAVIDIARVYGLATAKNSKNLAGSLGAAALLTGLNISNAFSQALGMPSARRDVLSAATSTGNAQLFNKAVIASRSWTDPDPNETNTIFRAMIADTVSGTALVNDAVSQADQQLAQFLQQKQSAQAQTGVQ